MRGIALGWLGCVTVALAAGAVVVAAPQAGELAGVTLLGGTAVAVFASSRHTEGLTVAGSVGVLVAAAGIVLSTANGVRASPNATVADVLLVAGALLLHRRLWVPRWLVWSTVVMAAGGVTALFVDTATGHDVVVTARIMFAVVAIPAIVIAAADTQRRAKLMMEAFTIGAVVNAAVALSDHSLHTTFGPRATGLDFSYVHRYGGLTTSPNHLALIAAMALPAAVGQAMNRSARHAVYVGMLVGAILVSGSRGGALAAAAGVAIVAFRQKRGRAVLAVGVVAAIVYAQQHTSSFVTLDRISGDETTYQSDSLRSIKLHESLAAIRAHPFTGSGFADIHLAHNIFLQLLQSGGVLLLAGFCIYMFRTLRIGLRMDSTGLYAGAAVVAWLTCGLIQNQVYDRYLYVPVGIVIAVWLRQRDRDDGTHGADAHVAGQ